MGAAPDQQEVNDERPETVGGRLGWAVALSALFMVVYGACNQITARRGDVGQAYFGWELGIPLVPVMIVPYMSIDLFFFGAPLLIRRRAGLVRHAKRVTTAILVAAAGFLLFPLTAGFPREAVGGVLGKVFEFLWGFDRPFNMAPSLHIALQVLLWEVYRKETSGWLRTLVRAWFLLIAASTVLTHQHHLLDIVTGFMLGRFCLAVFPDRGTRPRGNAKAMRRYAAGAVLVLVVAWALRPWGVVLIWPVLALAAMALAYRGAGAGVFGKVEGRVPVSSRLLLLPYYVGAWASFRHYTKNVTPCVEVTPGVVIGRKLTEPEAKKLIEDGVVAVLDLTAEYSETVAVRGNADVAYRNVPVLDLTTPTVEQLEEGVTFIREHVKRGTVYVHCALGFSRSAAVVAAHLMSVEAELMESQAIDRIKSCRGGAVMKDDVVRVLQEYARRNRPTRYAALT